MAFSPFRSKARHHGRSLSLPCKLHPAAVVRVPEPSSPSLPSVEKGLNCLRNSYHNIDDLLLLPSIQEKILQGWEEKWVDRVLDRYIRLLDACNTTKDILSQTKHDVQDLLSTLRRRDVQGIHSYETSRNNSRKMIQKSFKCLTGNKNDLPLEKDQEPMALICMLQESELLTIAVFKSLLSYVMGTTVQSRQQSGWSLVSKLMIQSKKALHPVKETNLNEFKMVDSFLQVICQEQVATTVEELINLLKKMESSFQILEEELESLFRQLVKTRVFLLNILNH